MDPEEPN